MYDLINRLREKHIKVKVVDDQLSLTVPQHIDASDIINEVKLHKQALINFLKKLQEPVASTGAESTSVALLKQTAENTNSLFLIHDGSGDIHAYISLANAIEKFNVWGIRSPFLNEIISQDKPIEEIVKGYIETIKQKQPYGPYKIGGWSLGGCLAYEVVKQMEEAGDQVSCLIMIDTWFLKQSVNNNLLSIHTEKEMIKSLLENEHHKVIDKCDSMKEVWNIFLDIIERDIAIFKKIKKLLSAEVSKMIPHVEDLSPSLFVKYANTIRVLRNAFDNYSPAGKVNAKMIYFKASGSQFDTDRLTYYCRQDVTISEIPGDHFTILQAPEVHLLANNIQAVVDAYLEEFA